LRYSLEAEDIDELLTRREIWRDRVRQRWPQNNFVRPHSPITDGTRETLHAFADFLKLATVPYKMVISVNQCWIYSNDTIFLERIERLPFVNSAKFTESVIVRPRNTVVLKNPQHNYRSYFRTTKLNGDEKQRILSFLQGQADVRISPALTEWIATPFNRTQDYFFVDYNTETWLTMLALIRPGLIRKTVQIVAK
jgi:signal peptidase I